MTRETSRRNSPRCASWREWSLARLKTLENGGSQTSKIHHAPRVVDRQTVQEEGLNWVRRTRLRDEECGLANGGNIWNLVPRASFLKKKKKEAAKLRSTSKIAKIRLFNFAEGLVPNSEKLYRVISCFCFHALPRIVHTGSCSFIIITGLNRHRCFPSDLRLRPFRKISCKLSQRFIRIVGLTGERSVAWEGLLINFQRHAIMECITCAQKRGLHGD